MMFFKKQKNKTKLEYKSKTLFISNDKKFILESINEQEILYIRKFKKDGVIEKEIFSIPTRAVKAIDFLCFSSIKTKLKLIIWIFISIFIILEFSLVHMFLMLVITFFMIYIDYKNLYRIKLYLEDDESNIFILILEFKEYNKACRIGRIIESHIDSKLQSKIFSSTYQYKLILKNTIDNYKDK